MREYFEREDIPVNETEVFLVATHLEIAIQKEKEETKMSKEILVVIGHRMGKGQAVAKGVEKAGRKGVCYPGNGSRYEAGRCDA